MGGRNAEGTPEALDGIVRVSIQSELTQKSEVTTHAERAISRQKKIYQSANEG